jgi:adenylate kinase family enzyme
MPTGCGDATLGSRIHVIGNSCSGKSALAARLSQALGLPLVELDALNWLPGWVGLNATDPAEFERRIREATSGDAWIVAGSYSGFSRRTFWPRLQTVIWLDLPLPTLLWRVIRRSWRRWRTKELLWGTNYERFWPQLMVWRKADSLVWWIVTQQQRKRREMRGFMADPALSHVRFQRLASARDVEEFVGCTFARLPVLPSRPSGETRRARNSRV